MRWFTWINWLERVPAPAMVTIWQRFLKILPPCGPTKDRWRRRWQLGAFSPSFTGARCCCCSVLATGLVFSFQGTAAVVCRSFTLEWAKKNAHSNNDFESAVVDVFLGRLWLLQELKIPFVASGGAPAAKTFFCSMCECNIMWPCAVGWELINYSKAIEFLGFRFHCDHMWFVETITETWAVT